MVYRNGGIIMLTIEEFRKLDDEEKEKRYKELSDHDRFIWRISCPVIPKTVNNNELTDEQRKKATEIRKRLLDEGKITQEQFNQFLES